MRAILSGGASPDRAAAARVADRAARVLRPPGALARLDDLAVWLAGWQRTDTPSVRRPTVIVFGADHGVAATGVSAFPPATTVAIRDAIVDGRATVNAFAASVGATVTFVDVGVGDPTGNIVTGPALSRNRFVAAFEAGRNALADTDADVVVLGEIGIGNTTAAAAVALGVFGGNAAEWTGPGTGVSGSALAGKVRAVEASVARVGEAEPMEMLRNVGGAELVAIAGATVEARLRSIPVVMDGFIASASVAPVEVTVPGALDHVVAGHLSTESGHGLLLGHLGKPPILRLDMRLGEGTGGLLALPVLRAAAAGVVNVATFDEAGVDVS